MEEFLFGIKLGLWLIGTPATIYVLIASIYFLASKNVIWAIAQEGTDKAIMKNGRFVRFVNYVYSANGTVPGGARLTPLKERNLFRGLHWVGVPFVKTVYEYNFKTVSLEQVEEGGKLVHKAVPCEGTTDHVSLKDTLLYGLIDNAETKELIPVEAGLLLTLRVINPYRALFLVDDWMRATLNHIKPAMRSFISKRGLKQLHAERETLSADASAFIHEAKADNFVRNNYGIKIVKADFAFINPSGERGKNIVEAATKEWEARQEAKRIRVTSDAEKRRIDTVYGAVINKGTEGLFIRTAEALEKAGAGQGNTIVFPLGMLDDLIRVWTGKPRS